jgi:hypothetical protein
MTFFGLKVGVMVALKSKSCGYEVWRLGTRDGMRQRAKVRAERDIHVNFDR